MFILVFIILVHQVKLNENVKSWQLAEIKKYYFFIIIFLLLVLLF